MKKSNSGVFHISELSGNDHDGRVIVVEQVGQSGRDKTFAVTTSDGTGTVVQARDTESAAKKAVKLL